MAVTVYVIWRIDRVGPCELRWTIYAETADLEILARLVAELDGRCEEVKIVTFEQEN